MFGFGGTDPPAARLSETVEPLLAAVALLSAHSGFAHTHSSAVTLRRLGAWTHTHKMRQRWCDGTQLLHGTAAAGQTETRLTLPA